MSEHEVEIGSKRSYDEYGEIKGEGYKDGGYKRPRSDVTKLRLLIIGKFCGSIIGKGGENIKRLRKEHSVQVNMPESRTDDRVVILTGDRDNIVNVVKELLGICQEAPYQADIKERTAFNLNLLVNTDQVGTVIGKAGTKIREIRDESNGKVKVYQDCLPNSNERVVAIGGDDLDKLIAALNIVLDMLNSRPLKSQTVFYDPGNTGNNNDMGDSRRDRDGGHNQQQQSGGGGGGFGALSGLNLGGLGLAGAATLLGQLGVGAGAGGILGAGGAGSMWGNNDLRAPANDGILGSGGARGGDRGFGMGRQSEGSGQDERSHRETRRENRRDHRTNGEPLDFMKMQTVTKVTVSNDMCGAIIGKGGSRIKEITSKTGVRVEFTEIEKGSKEDRVITLTGNQQQIQTAEQMMTECVRNRNQ